MFLIFVLLCSGGLNIWLLANNYLLSKRLDRKQKDIEILLDEHKKSIYNESMKHDRPMSKYYRKEVVNEYLSTTHSEGELQ